MQSGPLFSALLKPHRSLDPAGIRNVVLFTGILALVPGVLFFSIGAWPVVGLLGLDVLALAWAMSASLKSGDAFEEVTLWADNLEIRHVTPKGLERRHAFNPFWVRLDVTRDFEDRVVRIALRNRQEELEIGKFLTPDDKKSFAVSFSQALYRSRN